jgi:hypothetical protein
MEQLGDGIYQSKDLNALLVDCHNMRLNDVSQLDQLFGRIKLFSFKSGRRPYVLIDIYGARLDRTVSEYYSRQILNLLLEYVAGVSFYNGNEANSLVGLAKRAAPSRYYDKVAVFSNLTEAIEDLCDLQGLPDVVVPPGQVVAGQVNLAALAI